MSTRIGRVRLSLPAPMTADRDAQTFVRDLRTALSGAFAAATATYSGDAVYVVRKMRVTVDAPLDGVNGRDLASAIADACIAAAVTRSGEPAASDERGAAIVSAVGSGEGVRCAGQAEAAAAWLIALLSDDASMHDIPSPFDDVAHLPSSSAFLEVAERIGDMRGLLTALGSRWARAFITRCTTAEAERALNLLSRAETGVPDRSARAHAIEVLQSQSPTLEPAVRAILTAVELHARGFLQPVAAAREARAATLESDMTGCWLLLPYVRRHVAQWTENERRAIALALAERVGGAAAVHDPAIAAWFGDLTPGDLAALLPRNARLDRILVATLRDFARTFRGFERARCAYLIRTMLRGRGIVRDTGRLVTATLPRSPIRIVLERAGCAGPLEAPWPHPRLEVVRDDA